MLPVIIGSGLLFITCMVFIIRFVFGSFGKDPVLTSFTRLATILLIGLVISGGMLALREEGFRGDVDGSYHCNQYASDSTFIPPPQVR